MAESTPELEGGLGPLSATSFVNIPLAYVCENEEVMNHIN